MFTLDVVKLDLEAQSRDDLLKELVSLLELDDQAAALVFKPLKRRENIGSTASGKGITIPHCTVVGLVKRHGLKADLKRADIRAIRTHHSVGRHGIERAVVTDGRRRTIVQTGTVHRKERTQIEVECEQTPRPPEVCMIR